MRRASLVIGLFLALGACGAAGGRELRSGIAGRVLAGPTCPVATFPPRPGCAPRPLAASLLVRRVGSAEQAARVHSASDGRFRARLAPGRYTVVALAPAGSPFPRPPAPLAVRVRAGRFTRITVTYDTGIR